MHRLKKNLFLLINFKFQEGTKTVANIFVPAWFSPHKITTMLKAM
jgi:hypothetical protein